MIVAGRYVVAGMAGAAAVARIVDIDANGLVHVLPVALTSRMVKRLPIESELRGRHESC